MNSVNRFSRLIGELEQQLGDVEAYDNGNQRKQAGQKQHRHRYTVNSQEILSVEGRYPAMHLNELHLMGRPVVVFEHDQGQNQGHECEKCRDPSDGVMFFLVDKHKHQHTQKRHEDDVAQYRVTVTHFSSILLSRILSESRLPETPS